MIPSEQEREVKLIAEAVEQERIAGERRAVRAADAANSATIDRAADAALIAQAVDEARCKQLDQIKGTMGFYRWAIVGLVSVLFFVSGILVPVWLDRPMIKYNTWRLDKMEVEYPKKMDELKSISERNSITLIENSEKLGEMKTMLIALRAQK